MKPTLLVLAAGMGSRYGGLKQIDPMGPNGETMLDYAVSDAVKAGFGRVVFVIRRDIEEAFRETVGTRIPSSIEVDYAFQELADLPPSFVVPEGREKPWGTAHAVRAARKVVNEPFAVINADDFYGQEAFSSIGSWLREQDPERPAVAMVGYRLENTLSEHGSVNRGICVVENHLLRRIEEVEKLRLEKDGMVRGTPPSGFRREVAAQTPVSMNFWGFTPAVFPLLEQAFDIFLRKRIHESKSEWYLPAVVDEWIASGLLQCPVLETDSQWFGVTYPEDREKVTAALKEMGLTVER
ncbi:nucleotidyltransferase family protein [Puniceicoccus vermicola]|uniref:NTP transferase domain-containing protein n=1 Tax=Puniceicoccus vermicola TaxID=388746 RepID=A0A7X1E3C1_9BACT|nr:sugar phosphate nucleotidyltransferase [Puniceicoccus vermicola]MBC2600814.1 NTP transferase domain-containing protein [Puniceicoccus vermicola]